MFSTKVIQIHCVSCLLWLPRNIDKEYAMEYRCVHTHTRTLYHTRNTMHHTHRHTRKHTPCTTDTQKHTLCTTHTHTHTETHTMYYHTHTHTHIPCTIPDTHTHRNAHYVSHHSTHTLDSWMWSLEICIQCYFGKKGFFIPSLLSFLSSPFPHMDGIFAEIQTWFNTNA